MYRGPGTMVGGIQTKGVEPSLSSASRTEPLISHAIDDGLVVLVVVLRLGHRRGIHC